MSSGRYAIITLVMRGDRYIPGARVFGLSARDHLSTNPDKPVDLVCMVSADVSDRGRALLAHEFDHVVEVPLITGTYARTNGVFDGKYGSWIADSYTKWNCLGMTQYRRVAFFDADCLALGDIAGALTDERHIDRAAGVFSNSWSNTVMALTPDRLDPTKTPMFDEYAAHIGGNGRVAQTVPRSCIRNALDGPVDFNVGSDSASSRWTGMRFVCAGSSIMFQPFVNGDALFRQHLERLTRPNPRCGGSGPDDQSIVRFLLEYHPVHSTQSWQFLHAGWCFIPWKPALLQSQGLDLSDGVIQHYFNVKKPWESDRADWPDLESWWAVHDRLWKERIDGADPVEPVQTVQSTESCFHLLMRTDSAVLKQLLKTQLRRYPRLHQMLWERLVELVKTHVEDEQIYGGLRAYYHHVVLVQTTEAARAKALESTEVGASEGRADHRAQQVQAYIPARTRSSEPFGVLDLGCGNGTITRQLSLKLGPRNLYHGIDLRSVINSRVDPLIHYHGVDKDEPLPLGDCSVMVVVVLMSLHHMRDLDHKLQEVSRVAAPGCTLILREHDAPEGDSTFAALIDVMHGLYARVWPAVAECPTFVDQYYGRYLSRVQWRAKIDQLGRWKWVGGTKGLESGCLGRFYYDVWVKE